MTRPARHSYIGVDITPRAIDLFQQVDSGGPSSSRCAHLSHAGSDLTDAFQRIARILPRLGFRGGEIVIAAPAESCVGGLVEVPIKAGELPIPKLVRMELAREHRLDPATLESAWWDIPTPTRAGAGRPVMCVGCPSTILTTLESAASSAGLCIQAVDTRAAALARGLEGPDLPYAPWRILCDVSAGSPTVVISHEGTVVIEHRATETTLADVIQQVAGDCRTEPDVAETLCRISEFAAPRERRSRSFAQPRVNAAVREYILAAAQGVVQCSQYHHHRYGLPESELVGVVTGESWLVERFLQTMHEHGDTRWSAAPPGYNAARGLARWNTPAHTEHAA